MSSVPDAKACSKCGVVKALTEFYTCGGQGKRIAACKACHNAVCVAYARREDRKKKAREARQARRLACPEKAREADRRYEASRKEQRKAYRAANAERRGAYNAEYRRKNAAKVKASNDRYRQALGEVLLERLRQWRRDNPERYADIHSRWKKRNVELVRAEGHRRRCREKANGGSYTPEEWEALKAYYDYRCLACGRREPEIKLCVDHIIAVADGGSNEISNLQPLCRSCNSIKHRRPIDYRPAAGG